MAGLPREPRGPQRYQDPVSTERKHPIRTLSFRDHGVTARTPLARSALASGVPVSLVRRLEIVGSFDHEAEGGHHAEAGRGGCADPPERVLPEQRPCGARPGWRVA